MAFKHAVYASAICGEIVIGNPCIDFVTTPSSSSAAAYNLVVHRRGLLYAMYCLESRLSDGLGGDGLLGGNGHRLVLRRGGEVLTLDLWGS